MRALIKAQVIVNHPGSNVDATAYRLVADTDQSGDADAGHTVEVDEGLRQLWNPQSCAESRSDLEAGSVGAPEEVDAEVIDYGRPKGVRIREIGHSGVQGRNDGEDVHRAVGYDGRRIPRDAAGPAVLNGSRVIDLSNDLVTVAVVRPFWIGVVEAPATGIRIGVEANQFQCHRIEATG